MCEHQLEIHAINLIDIIEKSTGILLRRTLADADGDQDDDEDPDTAVDRSALHLSGILSADEVADPMRFCGDVAHEILKWTLSEASGSLTQDPEAYSTALQLLVELQAHNCFAYHTPSSGAGTGTEVGGREDRAEAKAKKWSRSGRGRAASLALDSAEALKWRPHVPATLFSHMVVLHDILGQEDEAEVMAQHIQSLLQTSARVHPPLRWDAALLPLEFAQVHGRIRAAAQDWLGAVTAFWAGLKWDLESSIARQARAGQVRRGFAAGAELAWEDETRRSMLRQSIKTELAFLLVRYLEDDSADATAQRLLLEVLQENEDCPRAKVTLALVLCYSTLVTAAQRWRSYSTFAHRTCPPLLPLDTPLAGAHAPRSERPTLQTAQELLEESVAEMMHRENLHGGQSIRAAGDIRAQLAQHYAPWALPKRMLLPPHLLSHALLFLGHLQRHTRGPEVARASYLASAENYSKELKRWHHRRAHTHHCECGTESSLLDESQQYTQRHQQEESREGFAVGFGTVWTWNALMANTGMASQAAKDSEIALLHAAATLIQQAEALLLQERRDRMLIMPLSSPMRRHLRPSSSPEESDHAEPYRCSSCNLSELALPPISGSFSGGGRFRQQSAGAASERGGWGGVAASLHDGASHMKNISSLVAFARESCARRAPQQQQRGTAAPQRRQADGRGSVATGASSGVAMGKMEREMEGDRARAFERIEERDMEREKESANCVQRASQLLSEAVALLLGQQRQSAYGAQDASDAGARTHNNAGWSQSPARGGAWSLLLGRAYSLLNQPLAAFLQLSVAAAAPHSDDHVVSGATFLMAQLLYSAGVSSTYSPRAASPGCGAHEDCRGKDAALGVVVVSDGCWQECCELIASLQVDWGTSSHEELKADLLHMRCSHSLYFQRALAALQLGSSGGGVDGKRDGVRIVEGVEGLLQEVLRREPRHVGALSALANFTWQTAGRRRRWRTRAKLDAEEAKLASLLQEQRARRERETAAKSLYPRQALKGAASAGEDVYEAAVAEAEERVRMLSRRLPAGEDDAEAEAEEEEQERHAMHWHERALQTEQHHPTSLLGMALVHMSCAQRIRRSRAATAGRGKASDVSHGRSPAGAARGSPADEESANVSEESAQRHVEEAERLLCRLLSSDLWFAPGLMAAAELLWQPLLLNRAREAEDIYRLMLLQCTVKPEGGSGLGRETAYMQSGRGHAGEGEGCAQLGASLLVQNMEERCTISYNLAFLLAMRGLETGNRLACSEASRRLAEVHALGRHRRSAAQLHAGITFLQARLHLWHRQPYEAEAGFRAILAVNPYHVDARLRLAQALNDSCWEEGGPRLQVNAVLGRWKHRREASCFATWASGM